MAGGAKTQANFDDPEHQARGRFLLPTTKGGPWRPVIMRGCIALGCILLCSICVWLTRGGYRDINGTPVSFLDAVYFSTVSLSTTGYGDIVPITGWARITNILVITPLRIIFLIVLVGSTIEVLTTRTRHVIRESRWRKTVQNHTVIIGFGVKGRSAVATLLEHGEDPRDIIVISEDTGAVEEATDLGCAGIVGNARREAVLHRASIEYARRIVVAPSADETAVLVTLTARKLAPNAVIVAAAHETANVEVLRSSGADGVIPTSAAAGRLMGMSLISPTAGAVMEDLLDAKRGLDVVERQVADDEIGADLSDLAAKGQIVLAVVRDGEVHRYLEKEVSHLNAGDRIVVIQKTAVQA